MNIHIVVAMDEQQTIGKDNALPWHLPADLKRFKQLTTAHSIIMGRKTYESIGRPLPDRHNIVLTSASTDFAGCTIFSSMQSALKYAKQLRTDAFIIGGAKVFTEALSYAHFLHITRVHGLVDGDIFFPRWDQTNWKLVESTNHPADESHLYSMTFETYHRNEDTPIKSV